MAPTAVFEHHFEGGRGHQWPRMAACYRDVRKHAREMGWCPLPLPPSLQTLDASVQHP